MNTEVYINGLLIDVSEEKDVVATYGNVTFGELNKRKGVQTNKWDAPFSPRNKTIFENSEIINSNSDIPYRKSTIEVKIKGVSVFYGWAVLEESENGYSIQSYARASDFYESISKKKLTELDLSRFNHDWGQSAILISYTQTEGYIYAFVVNGKAGAGGSLANEVPPDALLPHVYFHTIIKQIALDSGYTLVGKVLTNLRFLSHIMVCNKFPLPMKYGEEVILSQTLPDINQSKVWLDFANIYGLQFDVDPLSGIIHCDYIDDLVFSEPEDWSGKVDNSEKKTTNYSLGYGQKSYLKFKTDDDCPQSFEKEVIIDDETLEPESTIYESDFYLLQDSTFDPVYRLGDARSFKLKDNQNFRGTWISSAPYTPLIFDSVWHNGTYYKCILDNTNQMPPNPTYWTPIKESDLWTVKSRLMYGFLITYPSSLVYVSFSGSPVQITKILNNEQLDWNNTYQNHYEVFNRITKKTKKVKALMKLSYSDIDQLDFTRTKKIDNELFIVEDVRQFKLNKNDSTIVNFIRL